MIRALLWLHFWSWTNRWRAQLGRLRKPRYLAAFIVGVAYFYWAFLHRFLASRSALPAMSSPAYPREFAFALEPLGALLLLILVGLAWLVPSVALLWKNLISAGRLFTPRFAFLLFCLAGAMALPLGLAQSTKGWLPLLGFAAASGSFWILLVGPQPLRQDLRQDLLMADVLKQYPLAGWQIVLGEILAPAAILATLEWLALGMVLLGSPGFPGVGSWPWSTRLCWAGSLALLLPILIFMMLMIPNAAVLFLPSWFPLGSRFRAARSLGGIPDCLIKPPYA